MTPHETGFEALIAAAVKVLRAGGLVAFPTDTYYALGADAMNAAAVERVFAAKGRADGRPVPVLLGGPDGVGAVAREFPPAARDLARRFWPGALTIVLKRDPNVPDQVTAGGDSVGVRVPDHDLARTLLRAFGGPVTGTSANRSGGPPHKSAEAVRADIGAAVGLIITWECGPHNAPSTVVDFSSDPPVIVRQGAISLSDLRSIVPELGHTHT